jgi:hypothetical protein
VIVPHILQGERGAYGDSFPPSQSVRGIPGDAGPPGVQGQFVCALLYGYTLGLRTYFFLYVQISVTAIHFLKFT